MPISQVLQMAYRNYVRFSNEQFLFICHRFPFFFIEDALTDDEQSLVVLDPSHPLMIRYQERLKTFLLQREENLNIKLREADNELKVNPHSIEISIDYSFIRYRKFVKNVNHSVLIYTIYNKN